MDRPVCVYGATGYTGRLVCDELAGRGAPIVLAGRDGAKLEAEAARLRERGAWVSGVAVTGLGDQAALVRALDGAAVVVNAAGPFLTTGRPVLLAAMAAGVPYLDTTGEQPWIREVHDDHDLHLRRAGVAAVPAMGYDYVPGDLLAHLVGKLVEPVDEMVVAYDVVGFEMTRGSLHSGLELMKGGDVHYRDGSWVPAGRRPDTGVVDFPAPVGRRRMGPFPCGEVLTVPRHVRARNVRGLMSNRSLGATGPVEAVMPYVGPVVGALMRTPLAPRLHAAVDRLPEGPPEDERRAVRWTILVEARGGGRTVRGTASGPDIYGLTGALLAFGAIEVAEGRAGTAPGANSPVTAFPHDVLLAELERQGVTFELPEGARPATPDPIAQAVS